MNTYVSVILVAPGPKRRVLLGKLTCSIKYKY